MSTVPKSGLLPHGVIPPVLLPFGAGDAPDWESLATHVAWLADQGVDGLWLNGSTGEFHALRDEERTRVVEVAIEALAGRDLPIVNQVGSTSTRLAVRLAADAVAAGATTISAVLPYYMSYEQDECMAYLRAVKSAADGAPLYLYQVPVMTKTTASQDLILTLLEEGVIDGMKDSFGNLTWFSNLMERVAARGLALPTFIGDSTLLTTSMIAGGVGTITAGAAIIPKHIKRNVLAIQNGDWDTAIRLQSETVGFLQSMQLPTRPNVSRISTIKSLLTELGIIKEATCAEPFRQLDKDEHEYLRDHALPVAMALEATTEAS